MTEHSAAFHRGSTPVPAPADWAFRSIRTRDGASQTASALRDAASPAPDLSSGTPARRGAIRDPRAQRTGHVSAHDIYTGHFGLAARPFSLVPDPDFLYWSTAHQHAFSMLEYGIVTRAPITLITGDTGTGKTTLVFELLQSLPADITVGLITNTQGSPDELMRWILLALGLQAPREARQPDLVARIHDFLIAQYAAGRRVVLILDEAQNLGQEALEALRMLTNINSNKDELLQLILVGQPELRTLVARPALYQFAQRVTASYHLNAMPQAASRAYIAHRLRVAGATRGLFSEAAAAYIHQIAGGIPRLINQLCDMALVYAFAAEQQGVVRATVEQVLDDGAFFGAATPALLQ